MIYGKTELAWTILAGVLITSIILSLSGCLTGYDPCRDPSTRKTNMSCMTAEQIEQRWSFTPSGAGQKTVVKEVK